MLLVILILSVPEPGQETGRPGRTSRPGLFYLYFYCIWFGEILGHGSASRYIASLEAQLILQGTHLNLRRQMTRMLFARFSRRLQWNQLQVPEGLQ